MLEDEFLMLFISLKNISPEAWLKPPTCLGNLDSLKLLENRMEGKIKLYDSFMFCLEVARSNADAFKASLFFKAILTASSRLSDCASVKLKKTTVNNISLLLFLREHVCKECS